MNELQIFESAEFGKIRTLTINGEPYFVGKDVATILGYSKPKKAVRAYVDEDDRTDPGTIRDSMGRQYPVCINEFGLCSLILSSKLLNIKNFKRWIMDDVLPSMHKTINFTCGIYGNTPIKVWSKEGQILLSMSSEGGMKLTIPIELSNNKDVKK